MHWIFFVITVLILLQNLVDSLHTVESIKSNHDLIKKLDQVKGVYEDPFKAKQMGVENTRLKMKYLVFAMDKQAYEYLKVNTTINVYNMNNLDGSEVTSLPQLFRSKQFNIITAKKKEAVHDVMLLGYDVLFSDTDVAVVRDPFPYMVWKNVDYVHSLNAMCQVDKYWDFFYRSRIEGNTGFYFVRSNERTIKLWADAFAAAPKHPRLDDQAVFWKVIRQSQDPPPLPIQRCRDFNVENDQSALFHPRTKKHYLVSCMLDSCVFSSGMISRMYVPEQTIETLIENLNTLNESMVALHANYISGNEKKMAAMKEYGFWLADTKIDGSYKCKPYIPYKPATQGNIIKSRM